MSRTSRVFCGLAVLIAAEAVCYGQIGYPGGGYPGGGYPGGGRNPRSGGGPGLPFPGRGKRDKAKNSKNAPAVELQSIKGSLRRLDEDMVFLTADDTRQIEFRRTSSTKFYRANAEAAPEVFLPGDHIRVECSMSEEGYFTAVNLYHEKDGTADERSAAARRAPEIERSPVGADKQAGPEEERPRLKRADSKGTAPAGSDPAPKPQPDADPEPPVLSRTVVRDQEEDTDPDRPRLQRGRPARGASTAPASENPPPTASSPTASSAASTPAPPVVIREERAPEDPRITKAREQSNAFTETLPSYVVQQHIARYVSTTTKVDWHALDLVSADVVYEKGKEEYRNLKVNGKPVAKKMEQLDGAWSTGEFGTMLVDLFSPSTQAWFRLRGSSRAGTHLADRFDFEVDQENSHWNIMTAGQSVRPAYRGSVWIDKETSGVLRIEMQTRNMPEAFPFDKSEAAVDYELVRIGERQYLLPVHAENLTCQRGTSNCSRNAIDFRNYHKYSGEATITFENK